MKDKIQNINDINTPICNRREQEYLEDGNLIHSQSFSYNLHHLLTGKTDTYEGIQYPFTYTYDGLWRPQTKTSPSGLVTEYVYNTYGQVNQIKANDAPVWTLTAQNAKGQITDFTLGNGIVSHYNYMENGLLENIVSTHNTTVLQHFNYGYDNRYNLTVRNNEKTGEHEGFIYDNLNRLTEAKLNGTTYLQQYYINNNGNINYKSDVGKYGYGQRPHAVELIDTMGAVRENGITDDKQILEYTSFNKVSRVLQQVDNMPQEEYTIFYGLNQQRIKTFYYQENIMKFYRYYFGTYEKEIGYDGTKTHIDYIYAPTGLAAIRKVNGNNAEIYFVSNDNMNSVQLVTDHYGDIVNEYYYTPWGGRSRIDNTGLKEVTDRGYTGHEHLTALGLINMNGRVYDPVLARFLSPDPYVQAPDFSQGFNRFAYCWNNPFKYTDPSGNKMHWAWWLGIADVLTGGALSSVALFTAQAASQAVLMTANGFASFPVSSTMAIGSAIYVTALTASYAVSTTIGTVDLFASLGKGVFTGNWKGMKNFIHIEMERIIGIGSAFYFDKTANGFEWALQILNAMTLGQREELSSNMGNTYAHWLNIGGKVEKTGFFQGRLIVRLNTEIRPVSYSHYILGQNMAFSPCDYSSPNINRVEFAHEFGHTYQSRIMGPMYLFRIGMPSVNGNYGPTESDADRRGFTNLGVSTYGWYWNSNDFTVSTYKWYEFFGAGILWPFMWIWND